MQVKLSRAARIIIIVVSIATIVCLLLLYFNTKDSIQIKDNIVQQNVNNDFKGNNSTINPVSYISKLNALNNEIENLKNIPSLQKPINSLSISGWIPDWDLADGFETLKKYSETFSSVSPFWLLPQKNGHLKEVLNKTNPELISYVKEKHIKLIPTVPLFDKDLFKDIFTNEEYTSNFLSDLKDKVKKYGYDGIDLDFEEIEIEYKENLFNMLKKLKKQLSEENKMLTFTVLSQWGDEVLYTGHPQTRQVQNYKQLSDIVDELRIMTYDFYSRDSLAAGPIAPLEWMERVVQYTIFSGVPREKIVLGIPTYAYDWSDRSIADILNLNSDNTGLGSLFKLEPGDAYYHTAVEKVMSKYNLQYSFNNIWGEAIGRYEYEGKSRIVVFPTDETIQLRKQLAAEYGIKGVAFWRLGDEGSLNL